MSLELVPQEECLELGDVTQSRVLLCVSYFVGPRHQADLEY